MVNSATRAAVVVVVVAVAVAGVNPGAVSPAAVSAAAHMLDKSPSVTASTPRN
jgi:hypothetical protein